MPDPAAAPDPARRPTIILHLGLHKTGTTWIQDVLTANEGALRAAGIGTVRRRVMRQRFNPGIVEGRPEATAAARRFLSSRLQPAGLTRLILSEENMLGVPARMVRAARLYPSHPMRLAGLAAILAGAGTPVEVCLALRPQDEFGRALYLEALMNRDGPFRPPAEFAAAWARACPSFVPLVRAVTAALPDAQVTLWPFAAFRDDPHAILRLLAGEGAPALADAAADRRESPRRGAVLEKLARRGCPATDPGAPDGEAGAAYVLWTQAQRAALRAQWEADRETLAGLGPQLRWIGSG